MQGFLPFLADDGIEAPDKVTAVPFQSSSLMENAWVCCAALGRRKQ